MNPGNKLSSRSLSTANTMADETQEYIEHSFSIRAESDCTAYRYLTCERRARREESLFPFLRNIDGKFPGVGNTWLVPTQFAVRLVHRTIKCVPIDSGRADVHPKPRSMVEGTEDLVQQARTSDSRLINRTPVRCCIAAIDATPSKINAQIALFEIANPVARRDAVPRNDAPRSRARITTEHGDYVPARMKMACQNLAHLSAAAGYDDFHEGTYLRHTARIRRDFTSEPIPPRAPTRLAAKTSSVTSPAASPNSRKGSGRSHWVRADGDILVV